LYLVAGDGGVPVAGGGGPLPGEGVVALELAGGLPGGAGERDGARAGAGVAGGAGAGLVGGGDAVAVVGAGGEAGVRERGAVVGGVHGAPCAPGASVAAGLAFDLVTGDGGAAVERWWCPRDRDAAVAAALDGGGAGDAGHADDGHGVAPGGVGTCEIRGVLGGETVLVRVPGQDGDVDVGR